MSRKTPGSTVAYQTPGSTVAYQTPGSTVAYQLHSSIDQILGKKFTPIRRVVDPDPNWIRIQNAIY